MENRFVFKKSYKIVFMVCIVVGVVALAMGLLSKNIESSRFWANLLLNNYYFLALALGGVFFVYKKPYT